MEREELEQIPWSQLAMDVEDRIDRRWYIVGIAVGITIVAVLGFRLLAGSGGQPVPPPTTVASPDTTRQEISVTTSVALDVTEADLRAEPAAIAGHTEAFVVAEWFVTDWFTVDGSDETRASVRDRLDTDATGELPHDADGGDPSFVEWAKAFAADGTDAATAVSVVYRAIRMREGVVVREPVRAVVVDLVRTGSRWAVAGPPRPTVAP